MKYNLLGRRFGSLLVTGRGIHATSGVEEWKCQCDCGEVKVVPSGSLRAGKVKSCGCTTNVRKPKDIAGEVYGKLTILGFVGSAPNRVSIWAARCVCGNEIEVRKNNLAIDPKTGSPNTVSCGCHKKAIHRARLTKHGETKHGQGKSKEYACWTNMRRRCLNPKHKAYKSYGAKGVTICPEWDDFESFLSDVGRAPTDKPCIDRIDPYGNYEPSNVRWTDQETSNSNKRLPI